MMADSHSNSSSSSSNHSGNRFANRSKISGGSKQSSPHSPASVSPSSSYVIARNWPGLCGDSIFDGHIPIGSKLYDSVDDEREIATKAVAIVVNATRKGVVSLCAEFAGLLRTKRRLELALAIQKQGLPTHFQVQSSHGANRLSNSSSGSGGSVGSRDRGTQTKIFHKSLVHQSTSTTLSSPESSDRQTCPTTETDSPRNPSSERSLKETASVEALQEELKKALEKNAKLEAELFAIKAQFQLQQSTAKEGAFCTNHGTNRSAANTHNKQICIKEQETLSTQSTSGPMETLNKEFPHIIQTEQGQAHEMNCNLKSCVKHRNKIGIRPFSSPFKVFPSPPVDPQLVRKAASFTNGQCLSVTSNELVQPHENHFTKDKKPRCSKPVVLPNLGDHVVIEGNLRGIVKHIGPVQGEIKTYVGLHLDCPVGNNNGTIDGVWYFSCPPHYGAFVPIESVVSVLAKKNIVKDVISISNLPVKTRRGVQSLMSRERSTSSPLPNSPVERQSIESAA